MGRPLAVVDGLPCGREAQLAFLAAEGLTDLQIAERLGISQSTVSSYWRRTLASHGVKTRTELVAQSLREKIAHQQSRLDEQQGTIDSLNGEVGRLKRLVRRLRSSTPAPDTSALKASDDLHDRARCL